VENDDVILVDIPRRRLDIVGIAGQEMPEEDILRVLEERRRHWKPPVFRHKGVLRQYTRLARPALQGGSSAHGSPGE